MSLFVLIKEKMAPPLAFILLPIIAAVLAGFGVADISEFIKTGMKTMMNTAILFIFSISYFTLMSDAGLFDPIINFLIKRTGKSITTVLIAVLLTTFASPYDTKNAPLRIALRRSGRMSLKRSAAGGESCKQDSFSMQC